MQEILPLYPVHNFDGNRSLKDYTMLKLNSLEPFIIQAVASVNTRLDELSSDFDNKIKDSLA